MKKRVFGLAAATALAVAAIAAPASALNPPGDAAPLGDCEPNNISVVTSFPGVNGVSVALFEHGRLGPWNAHFNAEPVTECD